MQVKMDKITFIYNIYTIFRNSSIGWKIVTIVTIVCNIMVVIYYVTKLVKAKHENFYIHARVVVKSETTTDYTSVLCNRRNNILIPTNIVALIEITNKSPRLSKVYSYKTKINIGKEWVDLDVVSGLGLKNIYAVPGGDLKKARSIKFKEPIFDQLAKDKMLKQGEVLTGWIFLKLPEIYTERREKLGKIKLCIENSLGETQESLLGTKKEGSILAGGGLEIIEIMDLSQHKISDRF